MVLAEDDASIDSALAYYFERQDRGEAIDEAGLVAKFPQHAAELTSFFADQRLINAKLQQLWSTGTAGKSVAANRLSVHCPNCRQPTEVAVDSTLMDIDCPSCASRFSLIGPSAKSNGSAPLMSIGRFQLLERLGMGAYGSVWKARDDSLDRVVAVKIPRQGGMTVEEQLKFLREARAAAQLRHPNVVSVHEVGRDGDSVYIVSDFVNGMTLGEWLEGHQLTVRDAAELGLTIASALHHAHEHGVVHRDLKPTNIMMDADGQPHVMDFGLARRDAGEVTVTMDGQVLGTPAYMSPEQAEGKAHEADCRSDVYSLGVILFQLLTGELPFRGNARMLMHQVIHDEPPSPRKFNSHVPRDMETIVGKSMEKRPADRYASAWELADDLRRYLAGESLKAKPASPVERFVKWSRRHRTIVSVVAGAAIVLIGVTVASFLLINKERVTALEALDETSEMLYMANMNAAYDAWDQGWSDEVQTILARQKPKSARRDWRGLEWYLLDCATRPPKPVVLTGHAGAVNELAVFPDRRHLASVGDDGTLRRWDLATDTTETIPLGKEPVHSVAISPDGRYMAAGSRTLYLCDGNDRANPRALFRAEHNFESLVFTPSGQHVAGGLRYHEVVLFTRDGEIVKRVPCMSRVESLEFTQGQQLLVPNFGRDQVGNTHTVIEFWNDDVTRLEQKFRPRGHIGVNLVRSSPSGQLLAASDRAKSRITVLHQASGRVLLETPRGRALATALAYSPNGHTIAVGYENGVFGFLDLSAIKDHSETTQSPTRSIGAHNGVISDVKFIRNELVATCGADGLVKVWDLTQLERQISHRLQKVFSFGLSPDGELLACVGREHFTLLNRRGQVIRRERLEGAHKRIFWSPSGSRVAVARAFQSDVVVFDRTGNLVSTIAHERARAASFSPDDERLAIVGGADLKLYRVEDGSVIDRQDLKSEANCVGFSPDGRYLAFGGNSPSIMIADSTGQRALRELPCSSHPTVLAFSPDGSLLATGHGDSAIRVWSVANGKLKKELVKHERDVARLAFSANGRTLLSAAWDGTIRAWSVDQSRDYGVVYRVDMLDESQPSDALCDFSLSANDRRLAVLYHDRAHDDDIIELWDLQEPTTAADQAKRR